MQLKSSSDRGSPDRTRRHNIARACVMLLLLQFVLSSFACPALPQRLSPDTPSVARTDPATQWKGCDEHPDPRGLLTSKLRHERYVSEQAVDTRLPGIVELPEMIPLVVMLPLPVHPQHTPAVGDLAARATAPPIPIRFLVLRI